ncbi:MAG: RNA methyltransferase [Lysobacterales bacterium]
MVATVNTQLRNVRIVLVRTSHAGNIGAAARAMRTMGLANLVLVAPQRPIDDSARALAAGGVDLLDRAVYVPTLDAAVAECVTVFGCTARSRTVSLPQMSPRQAAAAMLDLTRAGPVALVFGSERTGLTNQELMRCAVQVHIAADPDYPSLNLAAAVQVAAYELRCAAMERAATDVDASGHAPRDDARSDPALADSATAAQLEGLATHLKHALFVVDFFKGRVPDRLMRRLRRLSQRARMTTAEVALLRGILSDVERVAELSGFEPRPLPERRSRR